MLEVLYSELSNLQERMHRKSKEKFRKYLEAKAKVLNLPYKVMPKTFASKNVVIGDLRRAKYVLGAHYDTPPRMPAFLMRSVLFFNILFTILFFSFIFIINYFNLHTVGLPIFILLYFHIFGIGIANKYNFNDNTSGVLTLLALMHEINSHDVAYVFFDNEEKGLIGSTQLAAFLKKSKSYNINNKKFLIFDCVGRGNVFGITSVKNNLNKDLIKYAHNTSEFKFEIRKPSIFEGSDHFAFKGYQNVGIMCYNKVGKKYLLKNIHSHKDRDINLENIMVLTDLIKRYIEGDV